MGGVEDVFVLLAHAGEAVDGEEAAVGDDAVAPVHQPVALALVHGGRVVVEVGVAAGGEWEAVVVVGKHVLAIEVFELQRVRVARSAKDRQRDFAARAVVLGPVYVEEVRVVRILPVLEYVPPPPVAPRHFHAEVVRHDIHHQPQPGVVRHTGKPAQPVNAAEFRVDHGRVDHVVVVVGLRRGGEDRGEVEVRDPEIGQIGHKLGGLGEAELAAVRVRMRAAQLQAVRGGDGALHAPHPSWILRGAAGETPRNRPAHSRRASAAPPRRRPRRKRIARASRGWRRPARSPAAERPRSGGAAR